ncbi:replication protein [Mesobacillus stamsii]|uniref:Replication protein n=1 Tax=Mesobacillus stamsii TaxID=225347 RepID=A0ABU0FW94_9BACI|nr:replication protein [Mesobacillus stamsii]MDQ0414196.1 hypothetical protein [Mesobacillus stamsii]
MQGYVKLYRKTMDSIIWQDPYYLKLWMYCLMKASHKEHNQLVGNQNIMLKEGEFITGRSSLSDDLNKGMKPNFKQSEISWWRYLNNLEKWGMLNIKKTNKYSVVSILKWYEYQETEQQMNNKCTTDEQQLITNKNVKNVKNDKNEKNKKINSRKRVYDVDSIHYQLADRLFKKILLNNSEYKQPNLQKWADDIRLMMEIDKRNAEQITYVIDWSQTHQFWKTNILSVSKLRDKYDQLVIQIKAGKTDKPKPKKEALPVDFEKWQRAGEQKSGQHEYDDDFEVEREKLAAELAAMKR